MTKLCISSNIPAVQGTGLFIIANAIIMTYFMAINWKKREKMCLTSNVLYSRKTQNIIIRCLHCTTAANNPATLQHAPASANDPLPLIFHTKISDFSSDHAANISSYEFVVYGVTSSTVTQNSDIFQIIYWTSNGKWKKNQ